MPKISVIGTGLSGLIGSKLVADFSDQYDFINLDRNDPQNPVDILNAQQINEIFKNSSAQFVLHFAAFTNVNAASEQNGDKNGPAYQVNVVGTENIARAAANYNKHLIHISTAYVFDGKNLEPYLETDNPNPIEWYGQTKFWAEETVESIASSYTILRIDQPFRADPFSRPDVVRKMIKLIKDERPIFTDHYIGPTFIDDFSKVINWIMRTKPQGLFHASSGEKWSDYDFAQAIASSLGLKELVVPGKLADYLKNINRPYQQNTSLNCQKLISLLDFKLTPIKEALKQVKI